MWWVGNKRVGQCKVEVKVEITSERIGRTTFHCQKRVGHKGPHVISNPAHNEDLEVVCNEDHL